MAVDDVFLRWWWVTDFCEIFKTTSSLSQNFLKFSSKYGNKFAKISSNFICIICSDFLQNLVKNPRAISTISSNIFKTFANFFQNLLKFFLKIFSVFTFCKISRILFKYFSKTLRICGAIWQTILKVRKRDLEIFMAAHRGENEERSEKKLSQKLNSTPRYGVPKVKVAKS